MKHDVYRFIDVSTRGVVRIWRGYGVHLGIDLEITKKFVGLEVRILYWSLLIRLWRIAVQSDKHWSKPRPHWEVA